MAYPTTSELVSASSVEALTSLSAPEQDSLRDAAIAAIELHTNQAFDSEENVTKIVSGTGGMYLALPRRLYVVRDVRVNGVALTITDLEVNETGSKLYFKSLAGANYYERTLRELDDDVQKFSSGVENVAINGDWGWLTPPPAVAVALRFDMEDSALAEQSEIGPTIQAYRKLGLKDISQGNLSASIGDVPTITPRVRNMLAGLIWRDPVGVVV